MKCMRCGKDVEPGQVFCEECLAFAEKYPVNPNTNVYLPMQRQTSPVRKAPKKRTVPLEEQIADLRKRLRFFVIWSLVSTVLALLLVYPAVMHLLEDRFAPGQNYSSFTTMEPSETTQPVTEGDFV